MGAGLVVQRLLWATVLAGCIGYERKRHGRAAGFRTHILVGMGSCLVMLTGLDLMEVLAQRVQIDPTRLAGQVISGIGFLGAGTILQFRASIRGLTTAASLWTVASVGLAVGAGFLVGAVSATVIVLIALFGLTDLEWRIRKEWFKRLIVETHDGAEYLARLRSVLLSHQAEVRDLDAQPSPIRGECLVEFDVKLPSVRAEDAILAEVLRLEGTRRAHWA